MTKLERLAEIKKDFEGSEEYGFQTLFWLITNLENELAKSAKLREALHDIRYSFKMSEDERMDRAESALAEYGKEQL